MQRAQLILFDRPNSQLFFNIDTTISYVFLPVMSKSLHALLVKICTSGDDPLSPLLECTTHPSLSSHPLFGLQKRSASTDECQWVPFFSSWTEEFIDIPLLPCQMPLRQTAPLLPSVTWQQHIMRYWCSISTTVPYSTTVLYTNIQHCELT